MCNLPLTRLEQIEDFSSVAELMLGGIVTAVREGQTSRGKPYGIVTMEDYSGKGELALFGEEWARWNGYMRVGNSLFITAKAVPKTWRPDEFELRIGNVSFLSDVKDKRLLNLTITISENDLDEHLCTELSELFRAEPEGKASVFLHIYSPAHQSTIALTSRLAPILLSKKLMDTLEAHPAISCEVR